MSVVSQEPPSLSQKPGELRSGRWVCTSPTLLSGSPEEGVNGSRKKRCNVAKTPLTVSDSCKPRAVHPTTTRKDGGAWHTFGKAFPPKKNRRFLSLCLTTDCLLFDIGHFTSYLALLFFFLAL